MLPAVAIPHPGLTVRTLEGVKRARASFPSSYDSIQSTPLPGENVVGINDNATVPTLNVRAPWTYLAIPFQAHRWVNEMVEDSFVFVARHYPGIIKNKEDGNRVAIIGLPQLHYQIHMGSLEEPERYSPAQVLREWHPAGVMISHPETVGPDGGERAIIIDSKGLLRTLNFWGENVFGGDHLWFVLKKVRITPDTCYVTDQAGMLVHKPGIRGRKNQFVVNYVTRFVPVISQNRRSVDFNDLLYEDEDCVKKIGIPIYVGKVDVNTAWSASASHNTVIDSASKNSPTLNMMRMWRQKRIELFLDISR